MNNENITSIENVTLLIPIYPPHYHYMYKLIDSLKLHSIKIDIHLIFSNMADYDTFSMKDCIIPIVCDAYQTRSIITYKKFFGLKQLAHFKYEYIICCDSEIDIIHNNFTADNINSKIKQIFNTKTIYAGNADGNSVGTLITQTSANLFQDKYDYLKHVTKNFTLYFWWSDLPVYRTLDITPFFKMISYDSIVWEHFDYIIYQYYLILSDDFKIIDTTPITNTHWSLEMLFTDNVDILNKLVDINYGFSWITQRLYNLNKNFINTQKGFLIYHLDR